METLLEFKPEIWRSEAACMRVGVPTDVFFSDHLGDIAEAKRICADCPVILECLEAAIARHEPWGVWGGQIFRKGKLIAKNGRKKYFKYFNSNLVSQYILDKTFDFKTNNRFIWDRI